MLPSIVGIAGKANAGKDTLGSLISNKYGHDMESFAAPMKSMLNEIFYYAGGSYWESREWKEANNTLIGKSPRRMAQTLGTEWGRTLINPDLWVLLLQARTKYSPKIVITDVRFLNEVEWIHANGGIVCYIRRPNEISTNFSHVSEQTPALVADIQIVNNSTPEGMLTQLEDRYASL